MTHVLYIEHTLVYSNKNPLPINDVIASLEAMRRVSATLLPSALSKLTSSKIKSIEVLVEGFEYGSFHESFWLQLVFSSERSMKRFQKAFRAADVAGMYKELPMGNKPVVKTVIVSSVIAALLTYGVVKFVGVNGTPAEKALVEANNNTVIMIGAEAYQADPAAFRGIIEAVGYAKQKQLAEDAAKVLAPAKNEPGAKLDFGGNLEVPSTVVAAMPREVEFDTPEREQVFKNVLVDVRSTNRDSTSSGWAGRITGPVDSRVRLSLGPDVAIKDLAGKLEVQADVTVRYKLNGARNFVPSEIIIDRLR